MIVLITYPLKQGLKLQALRVADCHNLVLITYPLKQGLKHEASQIYALGGLCSNYLSTKTRIETFPLIPFLTK
ncbi:hypothetical protein GMMP15_1900018 [Candidatus Magnetomoraceae bacterium gMMP-15]